MIGTDFTGIYDLNGRFHSEYGDIIYRMLFYSKKAHREGLLGLEDDLNLIDNTLMKNMLQLVVEGTDPEFVKAAGYEWLSFIIKELGSIHNSVKFVILNYKEPEFETLFLHYVKSVSVNPGSIIYNEIKDVILPLLKDRQLPHCVSDEYREIIETAVSGFERSMLEAMLDERFRIISERNRRFYEAVMDGVSSIQRGTPSLTAARRMRSILEMVNYRQKTVAEDCSHVWLVPPVYDSVLSFEHGMAIIESNGKFGMINSRGVIVSMPVYQKIRKSRNGVFSVKFDGKWGFLGDNGIQILKPEFDSIDPFFINDSIKVWKDGKPGVFNIYSGYSAISEYENREEKADNTDKDVSEVLYTIWGSKSGLLKLVKNGKIGILNSDSEILLEPQFDEIGYLGFCDGLLAVKRDGKWGFIDENGALVIEPVFDSVNSFKEGLCAVKEDGVWGFIDTTGEYISEESFESVENFRSDFAYVKTGGLWGAINREGGYIVKPEFDWIDLSADIKFVPARVIQGGFYGLIGSSGDFIVEPFYDRLCLSGEQIFYAMKEGCYSDTEYKLFHFEKNGKHGFIDYSGAVVIEPEYDWIYDFSEGKALALKNGKWGFIDVKGRSLTEFIFDDGDDVSEGVAAVSVGGWWGFIEL